MATVPALEAVDLHRSYREGPVHVHAVRGVNLEIKRGDFVAIMGSSGSGKSTMMNILGCLDQPTSGTFLLDGVDTSHLDTNRLADLRNQKLGFVFQRQQRGDEICEIGATLHGRHGSQHVRR